MNENKLIKEDLEIKGFKLQSLNLHERYLKDKVGYGVLQYQWFDKGSFKVLVRTGLKKDIIVSDQYNENYKRLLLNSIKDKKIPFYIDKQELEHGNTNISAYGFIYSLRNKELKKIGNEGIRFGLWPKGVKSYKPISRSVIECNFLYSEKKGLFFSGVNNVQFFLPKGESLRYYSRYMDRKLYYSLMKSVRLLLNTVITNLKNIRVEGLVQLNKDEQQRLLKRLMILDWLLRTKMNNLLRLLDNDSWGWRYNFYYLNEYVTELLKFLSYIKKMLLKLVELDLSDKEKKLLLYRLNSHQLENLKANELLEYTEKFIRISKEYQGSNLDKKYFIGFLNKVLKGSLEKDLLKLDDRIRIYKRNELMKMHLVASLDHFFKKSVVSVRSLRKLHVKLSELTQVKAVTGLLFGREF